jgi:hypothetical protein
MAMTKKKVFISYDFDNDKKLKDFMIGQAKNDDSPFEVSDHSLQEAAPQPDWEQKARAAIGRADVFIVMLGPKTAKASGVLKEVKIANELKKDRFQIIGYTNGSADLAVPDAGRTPNPPPPREGVIEQGDRVRVHDIREDCEDSCVQHPRQAPSGRPTQGRALCGALVTVAAQRTASGIFVDLLPHRTPGVLDQDGPSFGVSRVVP